MEASEFSHRNPKSKFARIDVEKRDGKGHGIITCDKNRVDKFVKRYQNLGYKIVNIKEC